VSEENDMWWNDLGKVRSFQGYLLKDHPRKHKTLNDLIENTQRMHKQKRKESCPHDVDKETKRRDTQVSPYKFPVHGRDIDDPTNGITT